MGYVNGQFNGDILWRLHNRGEISLAGSTRSRVLFTSCKSASLIVKTIETEETTVPVPVGPFADGRNSTTKTSYLNKCNFGHPPRRKRYYKHEQGAGGG